MASNRTGTAIDFVLPRPCDRIQESRTVEDVSMSQGLEQLDAISQAELVRIGKVSPLELVDATIARIERADGSINAVIDRYFDEARETAKRSAPKGPFGGVPLLLKDLVAASRGHRLQSGSRFLENAIAPADTTLVRRLKQAGFIILGKTNTPEFGLMPTTEPALHGPTRNPWDTRRSAGGSSGGSAAAVAMRYVPVAHGNDGGGSIRTPAACCGVFGFKPTRGRNPTGPYDGELPGGLVVEHALTLSVRDSAAVLDATSGPEPGDPYSAPAQTSSFLSAVKSPGRALKIAFSTAAPTGTAVHPSCRDAVAETASLCADIGHHVDEASPTFDAQAVLDAFVTVWTSACAASLAEMIHLLGRQPEPDDLEPGTWALWDYGRRHSAADYLGAVACLQRFGRILGQFFEEWDVWLTPTLTQPPPLLGWFEASENEPLAALTRAIELVPFPPIANATGQPAMSLPACWCKDGVPVGVHFIGRFGEESTLFRLAGQIEEARPWCGKLPQAAKLAEVQPA